MGLVGVLLGWLAGWLVLPRPYELLEAVRVSSGSGSGTLETEGRRVDASTTSSRHRFRKHLLQTDCLDDSMGFTQLYVLIRDLLAVCRPW